MPLSLDSVLHLIEEGGYGTYRLYMQPSNTFVGGSHITDDEKDIKKSPADIIAHLTKKLELLKEVGQTVYRLHLKKTNATQTQNEVRYDFVYPSAGNLAGVQQQMTNQYNGYNEMSGDKLEQIIKQRVTEALTAEREKYERDRKIDQLEREIREIKTQKRRRAPVSKFAGALKGLTDMGKIGMAAFIAERYPKAVPLVEKTLDTLASGEEEEEEEEEEETGFNRPAES